MDIFNESSLCAYFPGLVDVCINDDGQLVYVIRQNGKLIMSNEHCTTTENYALPERKHLPFTLPRAAEVIRYYEIQDDTIYDDVLAYLKRFSALDDEQWAIVAHYVFLTYLHDHPAIDYCPYLLFNAVPERGKSRSGKSIINIAFRGIHLVELREANMFRYSENLHGTLFFDIMDISKKAERSNCDDMLLLRYEKGAKCSRVLYPDRGAFNDTVYYDVYGPTIIATNKQADDILETRCLPIIMPNRPGNYENPRKEIGLELKERLTAWRAKYFQVELPDIETIEGISGRLWDITKPLFMVNALLPVDRSILEYSIQTIAGEKEKSRKGTVEGYLVAVIRDITLEKGLDKFGEWSINISDIRAKYNEGKSEDRHVSAQWIGKRLKSLGFRNRIVHGYSQIKIDHNEYETLIKQYGFIESEPFKPTQTLPIKDENNRDDLREVESGREFARASEHSFDSPGDREFYEMQEQQREYFAHAKTEEHQGSEDQEEGENQYELPF
jgi:hypothetical protein